MWNTIVDWFTNWQPVNWNAKEEKKTNYVFWIAFLIVCYCVAKNYKWIK